jgi:stress response protein SCP2
MTTPHHRSTTLRRGANAALSQTTLDIVVDGARPGGVDLLVLQLDAAGAVRSDDDLVFFNQPESPEGAVRLTAGDRVSVDLRAVPAGVERLAVAVALDDREPGSLAAVAGLGVTVTACAPGTESGSVHHAVAEGLSTERAAVLVEIYRRAGAWKVRSVSAGWSDGLAALVREHGVGVTESGAERLSPVLRQALDMRKREVHKVLLTKGAPGRARVVMVIDKTASMRRQYATRTVHRVVERMLPVAVHLDDDGALECYLYGRSFARLPDLRVGDLGTWPDTYLHLSGTHGGISYDRIGAANDEIPVMSDILAGITAGDPVPTLVLFFTDGGFQRRGPIRTLIRDAARLPAFWQFVGIGKADYGVLETLDELGGRVVDNAGFFALDDIDSITDGELYRRLLDEFPDWERAARAAGILGPVGP